MALFKTVQEFKTYSTNILKTLSPYNQEFLNHIKNQKSLKILQKTQKKQEELSQINIKIKQLEEQKTRQDKKNQLLVNIVNAKRQKIKLIVDIKKLFLQNSEAYLNQYATKIADLAQTTSKNIFQELLTNFNPNNSENMLLNFMKQIFNKVGEDLDLDGDKDLMDAFIGASLIATYKYIIFQIKKTKEENSTLQNKAQLINNINYNKYFPQGKSKPYSIFIEKQDINNPTKIKELARKELANQIGANITIINSKSVDIANNGDTYVQFDTHQTQLIKMTNKGNFIPTQDAIKINENLYELKGYYDLNAQ